MSSVRERFNQTLIGREISWMREQNRYQRTREPRLRGAKVEAELLIHSLFPAAEKPGSPEAKKLVLVGANVTAHVVSEICDPDTQFYLNGAMDAVCDWATEAADVREVQQVRRTFLASDLYRDYFKSYTDPAATQETRRMARAVKFVDDVLFGAVALDQKGIAGLDIADKKGETPFKPETSIGYDKENNAVSAMFGVLPSADAGIFSIAEMGGASFKPLLSQGYNSLAARAVASIPRYMAASAVGRFYGVESEPRTENPLFQERINEIIRQTLNPQPQGKS